MRYFENCGYAQIGQRIQISESGARMRVERALDRLQVLLRRRGIGSSAAALGALLAEQSVLAAPASLAARIVGSAGSVSAVIPSLILKSMTKTTVGILAVSLLAIGAGGYELQRAMRERGELVAVISQARFQRELAAQKRAQAEPAAQSKSSATSSSPTAAALPTAPSNIPLLELEKTDPETRRMIADVNRALLNQTFGQFVLVAGLADSQRMALYAAETEFLRERAINSPKGALSYQLPRDQVAAIAGEAAASQWDCYVQRLPVTGMVSNAALYAGFADAPLSVAQQDQLAQLMAQSAKPDSNDPGLNIASIDWSALSAQAKSFLNSNQLGAVRGALLEAQYTAAMAHAREGPVAESDANASKP